jgi:hypothetical protein
LEKIAAVSYCGNLKRPQWSTIGIQKPTLWATVEILNPHLQRGILKNFNILAKYGKKTEFLEASESGHLM